MSRYLVVAGLLVLGAGGAAAWQATSPSKQYRQYVGQTRTICGRVATYTFPGKEGSGDCTLRLQLGDPYWDSAFYLEVEGKGNSAVAPEPFLSSRVCATGVVASDTNKVPFIRVTNASDVRITDGAASTAFGSGAVHVCEAGVVAPQLRQNITPVYPPQEFERRARAGNYSTAVVFLQAVVAANGSLESYRTIYSEAPAFAAAAEEALRQWRFNPATRTGVPVRVVVEVEMKFTFK